MKWVPRRQDRHHPRTVAGVIQREALGENLSTLMDAIVKAKPSHQGTYIRSVVISAMSPGSRSAGTFYAAISRPMIQSGIQDSFISPNIQARALLPGRCLND